MTETVNKESATNEAREASKSRVVTQDNLLDKLLPQKTATESEDANKADSQQKQDGEKPKKTSQERIRELIDKRKEAEVKADAAERAAAELRAQMDALKSGAAPIETKPRPQRNQYATQEEYEDAVGDWRAEIKIAERERQQQEARAKQEFQELTAQWESRQAQVMTEIPDYAEVLSSADVQIPDHLFSELLESPHGPEIAYFLASNPDELKRVKSMNRSKTVRYLVKLEAELTADDKAEDKDEGKKDDKGASASTKAAPKTSKAPAPISPVKPVPTSSSASSADSFASYRERRRAEKAAARR